jgi:hypothetical protein
MIISVLVKQVKASTNIHYLNQLPPLHHFREIKKIRYALLPEFFENIESLKKCDNVKNNSKSYPSKS